MRGGQENDDYSTGRSKGHAKEEGREMLCFIAGILYYLYGPSRNCVRI